MKKRMKTAAACACAIASVGCAVLGFAGCGGKNVDPSKQVNAIADELALALLGDDIFSWNAYSVSPGKSFGYSRYGEPSWYSYSEISQSDIQQVKSAFESYKSMLDGIDINKLSNADAATYRSVGSVLDTYISYYGSSYAATFDLLGGDYINAEGGYVANFAMMFENFEFRTERDVKDLITVTQSTGDAFITYLDFADARVDAGYPLYDYSVCGMIEYLDEVIAADDEYYLYEVAASKVDGASFLAESVKTTYKNQFRSALDNSFMTGVSALAAGLDEYTGNVVNSDVSYLGGSGPAGKAYYEWMFAQKTGMTGVKMTTLYNDLIDVYFDTLDASDAVLAKVDGMSETDPDAYAEFNSYMDGEKALLDLETPQQVLDYLKIAAKKIVPDLKTTPDIGFKYMDETAASRTNTLAYYMSTPLDDLDATEHITINGYLLEQGGTDLLPLMAHEGYPGHLYAYVNAKENGTKLISAAMNCIAFSEGWAQYTALSVLNDIAETEGESAAGLYAEYSMYNMYSGYISSLLFDMQINYFGQRAQDYAGDDISIEEARGLIEAFMEDPAVYVPYGYGMYVMTSIHEEAKTALGDDYNAPEFNGRLLADGMAPTLKRAKEITAKYIAEKSEE